MGSGVHRLEEDRGTGGASGDIETARFRIGVESWPELR